jgi:hypothetical protein
MELTIDELRYLRQIFVDKVNKLDYRSENYAHSVNILDKVNDEIDRQVDIEIDQTDPVILQAERIDSAITPFLFRPVDPKLQGYEI